MLAVFPSHQWELGGWSDDSFSTSALQYIYAFNLKNAWQFTSGPTITYDWEADSDNDWSVPVGVGLAKTVKIGSTPWKFQLELQHFVEQPEDFGPEWFLEASNSAQLCPILFRKLLCVFFVDSPI